MPKEVQIHDKVFESFIPDSQIFKRVQELAEEISRDFADKNPLFVCILNGSFLFAADLIRSLRFQGEIEFVKVASYDSMTSTKEVKTMIGFNQKVNQRPVIILEDIVDTGRTAINLMEDIKQFNPLSVHMASLTFKREALEENFEPDYVGFEVPNVFLIGYGLDYDQAGRNLKDIYKLKDQ